MRACMMEVRDPSAVSSSRLPARLNFFWERGLFATSSQKETLSFPCDKIRMTATTLTNSVFTV